MSDERDIRRRQIEVARQVIAESKGSGTIRGLNTALKAAGLPGVNDALEMEAILNGWEIDPTPEQLAEQAQVMKAVAEFLREGGFQSLSDAMTKLNLTRDGVSAIIEQRMRAKSGLLDH